VVRSGVRRVEGLSAVVHQGVGAVNREGRNGGQIRAGRRDERGGIRLAGRSVVVRPGGKGGTRREGRSVVGHRGAAGLIVVGHRGVVGQSGAGRNGAGVIREDRSGADPSGMEHRGVEHCGGMVPGVVSLCAE
jgi:hypothetical protein